jgi:hypothetical protein
MQLWQWYIIKPLDQKTKKKKTYIQYVSYYLKLLKIIELCKSNEYFGGHSNFLFFHLGPLLITRSSISWTPKQFFFYKVCDLDH